MARDLSPSEAAARIGTTTRTVQRWIVAGVLPARRIGSRWRVASDALDAFVAASTTHERGRGPRATVGATARPATAEEMGTRSIRTVFIANRGEIAARIRRTCASLGLQAVVPATEGGDALDLLDPAAVVRAAVAARADALHPGFGFLAENADFAEAVEAAGIAWVGPPPDAIRAMGDKAAARRLAARLRVPVVAGYDGADQSDARLRRAARSLGYPLLVKPSAGGGGKGMRIVRAAGELGDALAAARREALAAFGDDRLVLERYLAGPRHVEVQVLFDRHGHGVHLGERDCSIQRRHQKVLEETPSPAVDPLLRDRMGRAALSLARAVGYASAGTCEFLLDDDGAFHFLEMNTRLQVEHPVTEAVTGRDLVADQLRIAAGDRLRLAQEEVAARGHAVEVRLYAEDAEAGFLPATGRVEALRWPAGDGIRVDAGIEVGSEIGGRFDPMLAKIVAHGRDRVEALTRLATALDETVVLGLVTNLRFLRWLVRQPGVRDGEARIDTLERIWPAVDEADRPRLPDRAWQRAAQLLSRDESGNPWAGAWRLNATPTVRVASDAEIRRVPLAAPTPVPAEEGTLPFAVLAGDTVHVDVGGRSVPFRLAPSPDVDRAARAAAHRDPGRAELSAPMPGAVLAVHVAPGDTVQSGDPVVTLEAMKMEHVVAAPFPGRVAEVTVAPGVQVVRGQALAVIEP